MTDLDLSQMSREARLDLIEVLWDSLDAEAVALTETQGQELDRRLAMLNANPGKSRDAFEALQELCS